MAAGLNSSFRFTRLCMLVCAASLATLFGTAIALLSAPKCEAAICPTGNGEIGSCFIALGNYPGEFPFAVTVIEAEQTVLVADLFSGVYYRFNQENLAQGTDDATPAAGPVGLATITGLAHNPVDGLLYWIVDSGAGQELVRTNTVGGAVEFLGAISSPEGGLIGDFTFQPTTGSFWAVDLENDIYFEFDDTGALILDGNNNPVFFSSPGLAPDGIGGEAYGAGIAAVPDNSGLNNVFFDVPNGFPSDGRSSRVSRVLGDGSEFGYVYDLDADNNVTGFAGGIAYSADGFPASGIDVAVEYIVDATSSRVLVVPAEAPTIRGVTDLTATADADSNVLLEWNNGVLYAQVEIRRDGVLIFTDNNSVQGPQSFTDPMVEEGSHTYTISPSTASSDLPERKVSVVVGNGRLLNFAAHAGVTPFGITVAEPSTVYVTDLNTGNAFRYDKQLNLIDSISSPFGMATTTGIAWRSTDDTLWWVNADAGELQQTDLNGVPTPGSMPIPLSSPAGGTIGDIAFDAISNSFWGVDVTQRVYFNFDDAGTILGFFSNPVIEGGNAIFGNSVTVIPGAIAFLDIPAGPAAAGQVNQVARLTNTGAFTDSSYATAPTTYSGFVNGVAFTPSGSSGVTSEYLVGNDTNTIYEVALNIELSTPFRRGDADASGAANLQDAIFILDFLFVGGANPTCLDAADSNDVAGVELTDATYLLNFLFASGPALPAPGSVACGIDATDDDNVSCDNYTGC